MLERIAIAIVAGLAVAVIKDRWDHMSNADAIAEEVPLSAMADTEAATELMA